MGSRGPLPESKSILAGRGSPLARGRVDDSPAPSPIRLEPPEWLGDEAKTLFRSASTVLAERGVLSAGDSFALCRYGSLAAEWIRLTATVESSGSTDDDGKLRPEARRLLAVADRLLALETALGLTPAARARIRLVPVGKPSPDKSRFFKAV